MALGFGFNKTKVLGAAEKFVQQGKLQNAINEYEKVIKEDPKDLTVLNAIGDLYARVGQNDKACEYFKKVGDQYAQNGFTVKAIAVYKKVTRFGAASDAVIRWLNCIPSRVCSMTLAPTTCRLPINCSSRGTITRPQKFCRRSWSWIRKTLPRSEERRVGKEC